MDARGEEERVLRRRARQGARQAPEQGVQQRAACNLLRRALRRRAVARGRRGGDEHSVCHPRGRRGRAAHLPAAPRARGGRHRLHVCGLSARQQDQRQPGVQPNRHRGVWQSDGRARQPRGLGAVAAQHQGLERGAHQAPRKRQREPAHVRDDPTGAGARVGAVHCQVQWPRRQSHSGAAAAGAGPGAGGHLQEVHHQEQLHRAHVGLHGHRPHDQRANRRHPGADQKGQRVFRAVCAAQRRDGGGGVDHGHGRLPAAVHHRRDALHCLRALPAAGGDRRPHPGQPRQRRLARRGGSALHRRLLPDQRPLLEPHGAAQQEERAGAAGVQGLRRDRGGDRGDFFQGAVAAAGRRGGAVGGAAV